jgi:hypothetical protein
MIIEYLKTPLNKYTFRSASIRNWVEENCAGEVLNLFAGETRLNVDETRNDLRSDANAECHMDALEFVNSWFGEQFNTVILDPPYSYRKSMELYQGKVTSPFNALKDAIRRVVLLGGNVITFGYHSVSMGEGRGFKQDKILLMSHGGAIHDTIAVSEIKIRE